MKSQKVNLTIRIEPELMQRIKATAATDERSINYIVEKALRAAFEPVKKKP